MLFKFTVLRCYTNKFTGGRENFNVTTIHCIKCVKGLVYTPNHTTSTKKKQSSPTTRHGGTWGERHSSYSFLTSALDGGKWSASHTGHALPRGKDPHYPLYRRLGGPQSRSGQRLEEKSFPLPGIEPCQTLY
jgi:hypothetical protein